MEKLTAFRGADIVAQGTETEVATALREQGAGPHHSGVLIFNHKGVQRELDLSGSFEEVVARYAAPPPPRGRPKLGVVAREVTLLPRHWDWLRRQRGGASAALRRLIDEASANETHGDPDAAYHFCSAIAGDLPGFEAAMRALYSDQADTFAQAVADWPKDIRTHAVRLAQGA